MTYSKNILSQRFQLHAQKTLIVRANECTLTHIHLIHIYKLFYSVSSSYSFDLQDVRWKEHRKMKQICLTQSGVFKASPDHQYLFTLNIRSCINTRKMSSHPIWVQYALQNTLNICFVNYYQSCLQNSSHAPEIIVPRSRAWLMKVKVSMPVVNYCSH